MVSLNHLEETFEVIKTVLKKKKNILVWINNSEKTSDASRK